MSTLGKPTKDQIQKLALSSIGFIVLLYVYFSFFLGPLNRNRETMERTMADLQQKLGSSKTEMTKAASLEQQATTATSRFSALQGLSPEGAPIAWFPPRIKLFFANQQVEKATIRQESSTPYKQPELANWMKYGWLIDLPQTDFITAGKAISELENSEPLLSISHISIRTGTEDPQFQQVNLTTNVAIVKR